MLPRSESEKALRTLFRKRRVADIEALSGVLDTRSRMSVFRRLRDLSYLSSYTHTGRYYTLWDIPEFDEDGLWRYEAIGFSRFGTLKATVIYHVGHAEAGRTHEELEALLRVRVFSTLHRLIRAGELSREMMGGTYVYVSPDPRQARRQLEARRQQEEAEASRPSLPTDEVVVLVLVEALHASEGLPAAPVVASRLEVRGEAVPHEQVKLVYDHFGLVPGKKTAGPR